MHMPNVPGRRWQDTRARLDIDQGTAAEALGINKRTLQNIETNPRQGVSLEVIYRAERLYGVPAAWLKGEDDTPPEQPEPKPQRETRDPDPSGPRPRRDERSGRGPRRDEMKQAS